jgi:SecD/SecF fusion protein
MPRILLKGLLICLILCLLIGVVVVRFNVYRLGTGIVGGTVLVYEVDLERTRQRNEGLSREGAGAEGRLPPTAGLSHEEMNQLATEIQRRIDPTEMKNVRARPLGDDRIEIVLPAAGTGKPSLSSEELDEAKRLISQMGVLEFRILANGYDDSEGILDAQLQIKEKMDESKARAERGLAPEGPDGTFKVEVGDSKARVRYAWVELGPEEREALKLTGTNEEPGALWGELSKNRDKAVMIDERHIGTENIRNCSMLLYSRTCISREQLTMEKMERDRLQREGKREEEITKLVDAKKYEYFVLTRISPKDSLLVGGGISLTATTVLDEKESPAIGFTFNKSGGEQFGELTRRNKPSGGVTRFLAIILDDRVLSVPTIQGEITNRGQISGKFDRKAADHMAHILGSGALSAELREKPVSEETIEPKLDADTIRRGTTISGAVLVLLLVIMISYICLTAGRGNRRSRKSGSSEVPGLVPGSAGAEANKT